MKLYFVRPGENAWPVEVSDKNVDDANFWPWMNAEAEQFQHMNYFLVTETTDIW